MAELTESAALVRHGQTLNEDEGLQFLKVLTMRDILHLCNRSRQHDQDGQGDGAPTRRENYTTYSISRELFVEIEASLKKQVKKSDSKWTDKVIERAHQGCFNVTPELLGQKRPEMATVRRLMFEKNIEKNYVEGADWEIPEALWHALGYEQACLYGVANSPNEIIMFHEGFDNAALSRSQRETPGKLDFKLHTLIGTKLGAIDWCTAKMAQRQFTAVLALRAFANPTFDPDHDKKLAEALSLLKDNDLDAKNPDRLKSLVTAWPLAQEVALFIRDHMEFLMQCRLNQDIEKGIRATAAFDETKPAIKHAGKDFNSTQMFPLHPALLQESGGGDIIAEENLVSRPQIEDITDEAGSEAGQREGDARAKAKALQKAKKERQKLRRRLQKEEEDAIKQAELSQRQQEARDAEVAKQRAIEEKMNAAKADFAQREQERRYAELTAQAEKDKKLKADRDANKVKQEQERLNKEAAKNARKAKQEEDRLSKQAAKTAMQARLVEQQRATKETQQTEFSAKSDTLEAQSLGKNTEKPSLKQESRAERRKREAAELAERHRREEAEEAAEEARLLESNRLQMIENQRIAAAEAQRKAEEAQIVAKVEFDRLAALEAQRVEDELLAAANARRMVEEANRIREKADYDRQFALDAQRIAENVAAQEKAAEIAARQAQEEQKKSKQESVKQKQKQKAATSSPEKTLKAPSRTPVPDSAFPDTLQRKTTTVVKREVAVPKPARAGQPADDNRAPPEIASISHFPALGNEKTPPKRVEHGAKTALSFSNSKVVGLVQKVPNVESATQFPALAPAPSTTAENGAKIAPSDSAITAPTGVVGVSPQKEDDNMSVNNTDVAGGSPGPSKPEEAVGPKGLDVYQQKGTTKKFTGADKPRLSVNTSVTGEMIVKSPPALTTESSPLEVAKGRIAADKVTRRNSIKLIRTRTDSRASMLQSPLAGPSTSVPQTPVTGLELPSPAVTEKSGKGFGKPKLSTPVTVANLPTPAVTEMPAQKTSQEVKPATSGGTRPSFALFKRDRPSGTVSDDSSAAPASASAYGHAHPEQTLVFMSEEPPEVVEHKEFESKVQAKDKGEVVEGVSKAVAATHEESPSEFQDKDKGNGKADKAVPHPVAAELMESEPKVPSKKKGKYKNKAAVPAAPAVPNFPFPNAPRHELAKSAADYPNDIRGPQRMKRIKLVAPYLLALSQGRYSGGEIVKLHFPMAHALGGGAGKLDFVLPTNRGDRKRAASVGVSPVDKDNTKHNLLWDPELVRELGRPLSKKGEIEPAERPRPYRRQSDSTFWQYRKSGPANFRS